VGPWKWWNTFDLCIIVLSAIAVVCSACNVVFPLGNLSYLRVIRIVRVVRAVKILHVTAWGREVRLILDFVAHSTYPVTCLLVYLFIFVYLVALGLTQLVDMVDLGSSDFDRETVFALYGSVWDTMFTLVMAISGGAAWRELLAPLESIDFGYYRLVFACFVSGLTFGILNLVLASIMNIMHVFTVLNHDQVLCQRAFKDKAIIGQLTQLLLEESR